MKCVNTFCYILFLPHPLLPITVEFAKADWMLDADDNVHGLILHLAT